MSFHSFRSTAIEGTRQVRLSHSSSCSMRLLSQDTTPSTRGYTRARLLAYHCTVWSPYSCSLNRLIKSQITEQNLTVTYTHSATHQGYGTIPLQSACEASTIYYTLTNHKLPVLLYVQPETEPKFRASYLFCTGLSLKGVHCTSTKTHKRLAHRQHWSVTILHTTTL